MADPGPEQKHQALFVQLVLMFHQMAWQQLGKIPNPVTNKIERDLEHARGTIEILDMLKARTKGNLHEEESRMLDHLLRELKLNYVDELDKANPAAAPPSPAPEDASTPPAGGEQTSAAASGTENS